MVYEALGLSRIIRVSPVRVIAPKFDTRLRLNMTLIGRTSGRNLGNMKQSTSIREHLTETHYHNALCRLRQIKGTQKC
jgi:hypothetical protein